MIQHLNCPYCGNKSGELACGCEESKLKWSTINPDGSVTYNRPISYGHIPKPQIKPLIKQDLIYFASTLPKVAPFKHEDTVISHYMLGGWVSVHKYAKAIHELAQEEVHRETFRQKLTTYTKRIESWLKNRLNNFQYD